MNRLERFLNKKFNAVKNFPQITPGVVLQVHRKGKLIAHLEYGTVYSYYDLASLTKIIFTATASIHYFSQNKDLLTQPIHKILPWWKRPTTPFELLTHTAGLEWWLPMYKKLDGPMDHEARWSQLKEELRHVKAKDRAKAVYSDVDLWMIGSYLETQTGRSLLEMWQAVCDRLDLSDIFFHPGNRPKFAKEKYAPTENCPWRKKIMQGEVHDENTWALGGIAPHSGLFGTVDAVSSWGLKLREGFLEKSELIGDSSMVQYFTERQIPRQIGDWGLGFMKPSKKNASAGKYFSLKSFGHTGFTGTSFWFDPVKDLMVVILSNRVHPTRENQRFVKFRPLIHNWIFEGINQ